MAAYMLDNHPYQITQENNGRWRTYVNMPEGGRKLIVKSTKEKVEEVVTDFYMRNSANK